MRQRLSIRGVWLLALVPLWMGCPAQTTPTAKSDKTIATDKPAKKKAPERAHKGTQTRMDPLSLVPKDTPVPGDIQYDGGFAVLGFAEAVVLGRETKKNVVLYLFTPWCGPCKQLSARVFPDQKFIEYGQTVVAIRVDASTESGKPVAQSYGVNSYPTTIVLEPEGKEIERFFGFHKTDDYIGRIRDYTQHRNTADDLMLRASKSPEDLDLNFRAGRALAIRDRGEEAIPFLERAIELDPENKTGKVPRSLLLLARTVYIDQMKAYDKAMPILERLSRDHPTTFHGKEATYMMARAYLEQKRIGKAKKVLLTQVVIDPRDGIQFYRFATFCLRYRILYDEAIKKVDAGLEKHPRGAYLWKAKADLHFRKRQYDEAIAALEKAIELQPNSKNYEKLLGIFRKAKAQHEGTK